jgi:hypothetical protein
MIILAVSHILRITSICMVRYIIDIRHRWRYVWISISNRRYLIMMQNRIISERIHFLHRDHGASLTGQWAGLTGGQRASQTGQRAGQTGVGLR